MDEAVATTLGVDYLYGYWQRALGLPGAPERAEDLDFALLSGLRLGLRQTLQLLHQTRPSFAEFETWIVEQNGGAMDERELDRLRRALAGEMSARLRAASKTWLD